MVAGLRLLTDPNIDEGCGLPPSPRPSPARGEGEGRVLPARWGREDVVLDLYRRARDIGTPLVGGHRGNPAEQPENTMASFSSAMELGVDLIECDVHMSSDGELVVIHDHTLERTTSGTGLVFQHTAAELRRLEIGGASCRERGWV